jgi:MoxR-like ATPase
MTTFGQGDQGGGRGGGPLWSSPGGERAPQAEENLADGGTRPSYSDLLAVSPDDDRSATLPPEGGGSTLMGHPTAPRPAPIHHASPPSPSPTPRPQPGSDLSLPSLDQAARLANELRHQITKAVMGQDEVVDHVLAGFLAGGHVLLEGVPGLGKTLLVLALARAVGGKFSRIQFTPDLMPADVTGHAIYDQNVGQFRIRKGPVFANLLLGDEINRAPAKTQAALLEVMQEQQVTIEGEAFPLEPPFMTLATQNPIEQEGTYPLPEAQIDRFLLKVLMRYPDERDEVMIVQCVTQGRIGHLLDVSSVREVMSTVEAAALQRKVAQVTVDERIVSYAVRIVRATRSRQGVVVGAGPRGAIALVRVSRALALLQGRDFVTPDDIKGIALPALRHRVAVAPELEIEGLRADDVLRSILESVEAPRQ